MNKCDIYTWIFRWNIIKQDYSWKLTMRWTNTDNSLINEQQRRRSSFSAPPGEDVKSNFPTCHCASRAWYPWLFFSRLTNSLFHFGYNMCVCVCASTRLKDKNRKKSDRLLYFCFTDKWLFLLDDSKDIYLYYNKKKDEVISFFVYLHSKLCFEQISP